MVDHLGDSCLMIGQWLMNTQQTVDESGKSIGSLMVSDIDDG